jgi:ubiquinone/menaquinone biosynthesis C-methylase UbiE
LLPKPPAAVLDVGGGPGVHALWLARRGYSVHLVDPVPLHVEQALEVSAMAEHPLASATVGHARRLHIDNGRVDVALLLGPLYHLPDRADRSAALVEAARVLRSGGVMLAAAISRFASAIDSLTSGFIDDPRFVDIVDGGLTDGRHLNPTGSLDYFTTAFFHDPGQLRAEVAGAGFAEVEVLAVESFGWAAPDLDERLRDRERRERFLALIARVESEPSLLGASPHILAVGRKPAAAE